MSISTVVGAASVPAAGRLMSTLRVKELGRNGGGEETNQTSNTERHTRGQPKLGITRRDSPVSSVKRIELDCQNFPYFL